jgi:hypothetical protein
VCKLIILLYDLVPIQGFRAYLIKKHLAKCPVGQRDLDIETLLKEKFRIPGWIESEKSLWPHVREKIFAPETVPSASSERALRFTKPWWHWAVAGLALLVMAALNLLILRNFNHHPFQGESAVPPFTSTIIINHAEIKGRKAKPFIYQTHEACFIWFEESKSEGD